MALQTNAAKAAIKQLFNDMKTREVDSEEEFAERLMDILETWVKTGQVNTQVTTTGSASAQTGTGVGTIQ